MTEDRYYELMRLLVPINGEMPAHYKTEIVKYMKQHPDVKLEPATDKELGAIFNYLNHTSLDCDLFGNNPPYARYKDAVLCLNYKKTEWILLERIQEEQLWDLWYKIKQSQDDTLNKSMGSIFR